MGTGSSLLSRKKIFLQVADKEISVVFSPQCTVEEFKDLLASAAGLSRWSTFQLVDHEGSLVSLCPSIPTNTISTPYKLQHVANGSLDVDAPVISEVLTKASEVVVKAFRIQEFTQEFGTRLDKLEKKFEDGSSITTHHLSCKPSQDNNQPPTDSFIVNQKEMDSIMEKILSKETIEILKKPTFDIWHWEQNEMAILIEHMYHELGLIQSLNINLITFRKWLVAVQYNYRNNPFHNFRHCFCVTQMMYGMIHLLKLTDYLTKLELASLMTSCVCHDIDHPGYNNSYQINARTELAIRYNDISPLENHHCAITFQLLENDEYNIFANLKKEDFKQLRIWIIELILATDMARHSEYMELFKKIQSSFDFTNEEHKKIGKIMLIKSCDISNEVRPTKVAEPWVDCLLEEFFMQSDREKSEGLPVAPFMDRDKVTKPTAQIGFIKFVLIPMFESMNKVFPALEQPIILPLKSSLEHYERLKELEDMKKNQE